MQTLSPIGRNEIGGVSRTSVIAAAGISFLLGAVTPVAIRTAMNHLVHGTNSITSDLHRAPYTIEQTGGKSVHSVLLPRSSSVSDGVSSALESFIDEAKLVADEYGKKHSNSPSHADQGGREQIAADFIQFLLRELALDVADVYLNICPNQRVRQKPHEDDANEGEKVKVKSMGQLAGKPSTSLGSHVDEKSESSDPNRERNRSTIPRVLEEESSHDEGEDEDGHKINARFSKLPLETCVKCCPKDGKGGHRRTTNQVEHDVPLAHGADDKHRATWITPSWVESCVICCDEDDEPTTCPPVPAPAPCPTPPPTTSCPEPVPCPTPPPTTIPPPPVPCPTPPPSPSPAPDTCIEPLEDLDDFAPDCGSRLTRTYYRVRTFTIPEGCNVRTNGPLVVECVNATIHGSLIGKGQGGAGASGCALLSSLFNSDGECTPSSSAACLPLEDGQGSGGGRSAGSGTVVGGGGGGGGYGGKGGDSDDQVGGSTYVDLLPGSGGGAGLASLDNSEDGFGDATSGSGGNGGGLISFLTTDTFIVGDTGSIDVDGDDGGSGEGSVGEVTRIYGGGGGGSGGGVEVTACTAIIEGKITASGGRGGDGDVPGNVPALGGGGGGGGRIRIITETPLNVTMGCLIVNGGAGGGGADPGDDGNSTVLSL